MVLQSAIRLLWGSELVRRWISIRTPCWRSPVSNANTEADYDRSILSLTDESFRLIRLEAARTGSYRGGRVCQSPERNGPIFIYFKSSVIDLLENGRPPGTQEDAWLLASRLTGRSKG